MSATREFIMPIRIAFGDCDPAGIVYFPNFFRWFDAGMHEMFAAVGLSAEKVSRETGLVVWPSIDAKATFHAPARTGDLVEVRSSVAEWRSRTFVMSHRIVRGDTLICDGTVLRFVGERQPSHDDVKMRTVPVPDWMRQAFD
ncbi:MAG: acyl-CoA thioesterase [Betaproteobacteria bacterium]|nr:acyl-CoA thioesterase [Betaproteobacteria bacterium]